MEEGGKSQLWQYVQGLRATQGEPEQKSAYTLLESISKECFQSQILL